MPEQPFPMVKPSLAFAKLVASPTETSWSQVYNAGKVFACLSLTKKESADDETEEKTSLQIIGKDVFSNLEAEFFTLEKKNIETIKQAMALATKNIPATVTADFCLAYFNDAALYLFIAGKGRVIIKRGSRIGVLLEGHSSDHQTIETASGYLKNEDIVVLETKQFADDIPDDTLASALELALPNDIVESLTPQVHGKTGRGQAAIIIVFHGSSPLAHEPEPQEPESPSAPPIHHQHHQAAAHEKQPEEPETYDEDAYEEEDEKEHEENVSHEGHPFRHDADHKASAFDEEYEDDDEDEHIGTSRFENRSKFALPAGISKIFRNKPDISLPLSKRLFLVLGIVIVVLLVAGIYMTKKHQADKKQQELFESIYVPAQKKYDEGKALESLNKNLSHDDFTQAQQSLQSNIDKFKQGSDQEKQMKDLLAKVNTELQATSNAHTVTADAASDSDSPLLAKEKGISGASGFTQNTTTIYYVTDKAISSVGKSSGNKTDVVKNSGTWSAPAGLATYLGNFYLLDKKAGVLKFVSGSKSDYFKSTVDVSKATAIAIDSSVWILESDGTILKFTKGVADNFKAPSLDTPLSSPTKLVTDADTQNLYILDKGNGRIVKISKDGKDHTEYAADALKNAVDIDVKEADKKLFFLSGDKIWSISL